MEGEGWKELRDVVVNGEGRKLCKFLGEMGYAIINGDFKGDGRGEWTHVGWRGGSVIDYVIGNEEMSERVDMMVVEDRIDSDHQPVSVWIRGKRGRREYREEGRRGGDGRIQWSEEDRLKFAERFGEDEVGDGLVEVEWEGLKEKIAEALKGVEKGGVQRGRKG